MTSLNLFNLQTAVTGLTTATTLYTDGDVLGTAVFSWNVGFDEGLILGAVMVNATVNMGACDLFLYDRSVSAATNNTAHSVSDADRLFALGIISFPFPTNDALGQTAPVDSLAIPFDCNASTTIYGILVTRMTHTVHYGAATDISVRLFGSGDA